MKKKLKIRKKTQEIYMVWITSLLLGFYAYQQPFNKLLFEIRQAGIISISVDSLIENFPLVMQTVMPTVIMWLIVFFAWLVGMWYGTIKNQGIGDILFGRLINNKCAIDRLFYIGMWIEMIWSSLYYASFHMPFATILVFIAMQCFAFRIILMEHSSKEWAWIGILIALGIACEFYTTRGFVLRAVLLILASKEIELKRVLKHYLIVNAVACTVIICVSGLGIAGVWMEENAYRAVDEVQNRYVLGFNSPNTTHYVLIRLGLVALYIWWDKIKLWHTIVFFAINYMLYFLTDSRTGFIVGVIAVILTIFFKYFGIIKDWKIWYYMGIIMILTMVVFSLHFLHWNFYEYDTLRTCPDYVYKVNDMLVGRIHQALKYTQDIELSPIGTRQSGVYCDMGYIKFFLQEGFLIYGIYLVTVFKMILKQYRIKDYAGYIIIIAISFRMFMESSFVPFVFQNVILLLLIGNWSELLEPLNKKLEGKV